MKIIKVYISKSGKNYYRKWFEKIENTTTQNRIITRINRLKFSNYGDCKNLGDGIYELRMFFGKGYRVYFSEVNKTIILLFCGGDKSSQSEDIKKAKMLLKEYKETINE